MDLASLLKLHPIDLHTYSVLVRYDYLQHAWVQYPGYHSMRFNLYVMPSEQPALNAIWYAWGSCVEIGSPVQRPL